MKENGTTRHRMGRKDKIPSEGQKQIGLPTPKERAAQHNFKIGEPLPYQVLLGAWRPLQPTEAQGVHKPYIKEINGTPHIPVRLYGHQPISTNIPRHTIR